MRGGQNHCHRPQSVEQEQEEAHILSGRRGKLSRYENVCVHKRSVQLYIFIQRERETGESSILLLVRQAENLACSLAWVVASHRTLRSHRTLLIILKHTQPNMKESFTIEATRFHSTPHSTTDRY